MKQGLMGLALAIVLSAPVCSSHAQEKLTENTLKSSPGTKPPTATIDKAAWLAGQWSGEGLGAVVEELWSEPRHGVMLGTFRLLKADKAVFYEIITLAESNGSLVLRLKHFHADLRGWEEKDEVQEFPLVALEKDVLHFAGMSIHLVSPDALVVFLAMEEPGTAPREAKFTYRRKKVE